MATYTPNLNLKKPAGTDYVRVSDFNENANVLDASIGDLGQLQTTEKTNLVLAINETKQQGEHLPYVDETTKTWWVWNASLNQYEDSEESAKGVPGVSVTVGTTTTGAAGTQASVSNSGTASDPILNFTIPQGATGAGVPTGGTAGQILKKTSGANYATSWDAANNHEHGNISSAGAIGNTTDLPIFTGANGALGTKTVDSALTALTAARYYVNYSVQISGDNPSGTKAFTITGKGAIWIQLVGGANIEGLALCYVTNGGLSATTIINCTGVTIVGAIVEGVKTLTITTIASINLRVLAMGCTMEEIA